MKAVQAAYQPGHSSQTLFATSFGVSLLVHGLVIGWMLSGSGRAHSLLADVPSFQMVSLVDAPGMPEPQAIAEPAATPEAVRAVTVQNAAPEAAVPPPQAKEAAEVPEASVEPPAPVAKPKPVEAPERPSVVDTQVKKPEPATASVKKPTPTKTAAVESTPATPKVAAVQPKAAPAPNAAAKPRAPASRNSSQAAERARQTIANLRRAQARAQGSSTIQARGGTAAGIQEVLMRTYQNRVRARIINAWSLPMPSKMAQEFQAVVLLTIDREGQVIRYELIGPSGSQPFDASLQRAVQASSPLPPLPETFPGETQVFELHFTPPASS